MGADEASRHIGRNVRLAVRVKADGARSRGRTRAALVHAFNKVFLQRREGTPRVSEVAHHAGVARSTFYEHYAGMDDLHMQALSRPLSALADAIAGRGDAAGLEPVLQHFWENRDRARATFGGEMHAKVERLLAGMVLGRLPQSVPTPALPLRLAAVQLAGAQLTVMRAWLAGESHCAPRDLARSICATSASLRSSLFTARANGG
ncbi:MAG: hypothetical protein KF822_02905 [Steroidobacteraceae bacterium]|nr:hypothetical protein [Steroidobacteraceae bacterium]